MASGTVHSAEISVRDHTTKSVTLSLERATIVRQIKDVKIKPGPNEITIYGFDEHIDPDSVRVTGAGPATITDIQTSIIPQKEQFEDVYPVDQEDEEYSEGEDPDDDFGVDRSDLAEVESKLKDLEAKLADAENEQATSTRTLEFLDKYGRSVDKDVPVAKMKEYVDFYEIERKRLGTMHQKAAPVIEDLRKAIAKAKRLKDRRLTAFQRARDVAAKPEREERKKRREARRIKSQHKRKEENELKRFWPYNIGQLVVHLDGFGDSSPNLSRRASIISTEKLPVADAPAADCITLLVTYVTSKANWSPRYELFLSTPTSSAKVIYRAEYHNFSAETWKDVNMLLSTSQTAFSGVNEAIPFLQPWNVKLLQQDEGAAGQKDMKNWQGSVESRIEVRARAVNHGAKGFGASRTQPQKQTLNSNAGGYYSASSKPVVLPPLSPPPPRQGGLFGAPRVPPSPPPPANRFGGPTSPSLQTSNNAVPFGGYASYSPSSPPLASFGVPPSAPGQGFGQTSLGANPYANQGNVQLYSAPEPRLANREPPFIVGSARPPLRASDDLFSDSSQGSEPEEEDGDDADAATLSAASNIVGFQESSRQEFGLTTTYEIPGLRTLQPSSVQRRLVINELELSNINFSHLIIPKLRSAAFLKARITNESSTAFLRGKAGLTLDGTFLGTTVLPNCSPKSTVSLSLGVDPGIKVTYSKPRVRRATTGFFNKEDCAIFTRTCMINNSKPAAVTIVILDQVPVSEDDRLRIRILEPKGIEKPGDSAKVGSEVSESKRPWGKGTVSVEKSGKVKWAITLEKGAEIRLTLEYDARIPNGQKIVGLD